MKYANLASYFRKCIQNFAEIASPLTNLTQKNAAWVWDSPQKNAFDSLKNKLINKPVLAPFDPSLATEIHTDASSRGIGGILIQTPKDGSNKSVAYFSRVTTNAEKVYHSYELETI